MIINWAVTAQEATQILNALTERPYKEVAPLIAKLKVAADAQIVEHEKSNGKHATG